MVVSLEKASSVGNMMIILVKHMIPPVAGRIDETTRF